MICATGVEGCTCCRAPNPESSGMEEAEAWAWRAAGAIRSRAAAAVAGQNLAMRWEGMGWDDTAQLLCSKDRRKPAADGEAKSGGWPAESPVAAAANG